MNTSWLQAKISLIQHAGCQLHQPFILWTMNTWTNLGDPLFAALKLGYFLTNGKMPFARKYILTKWKVKVYFGQALTLCARPPWSRAPLAHKSPCWGRRAPAQPPRNPPGRRGWTRARRAARSGREPGGERQTESERRVESKRWAEIERQAKTGKHLIWLQILTTDIRKSPPCYMKPACSNIR